MDSAASMASSAGDAKHPPSPHHGLDFSDAESPCMDVVAVAASVLRRLLSEQAKDGQVALADAGRILDELTEAKGEFARMIKGQPAKCRAHGCGQGAVNGRKDPFRRLMVRPIELLLEGEPATFPREYLPNFFKVVTSAGGDWLAKTETASRAVLQSLVVTHGHQLTWEQFYADSRVHHILIHSLRHLIAYLETPAGQWLWEQGMLSPGYTGRAPAKAQTDQVYAALRDTWRALESENALHDRQHPGRGLGHPPGPP